MVSNSEILNIPITSNGICNKISIRCVNATTASFKLSHTISQGDIPSINEGLDYVLDTVNSTDNEPIEGSDHLVKSGGVYAQISALNIELNGRDISYTKEITVASAMSVNNTYVIDIPAGDVSIMLDDPRSALKITNPSIIFKDSDGNILSTSFTGSTVKTVSLTRAATSMHFYVTGSNVNGGTFSFQVYSEEKTSNISDTLNTLNKDLKSFYSENLIGIESSLVKHFYWGDNGVIITSAHDCYVYDISEKESVVVKFNNNGSNRRIAFSNSLIDSGTLVNYSFDVTQDSIEINNSSDYKYLYVLNYTDITFYESEVYFRSALSTKEELNAVNTSLIGTEGKVEEISKVIYGESGITQEYEITTTGGVNKTYQLAIPDGDIYVVLNDPNSALKITNPSIIFKDANGSTIKSDSFTGSIPKKITVTTDVASIQFYVSESNVNGGTFSFVVYTKQTNFGIYKEPLVANYLGYDISVDANEFEFGYVASDGTIQGTSGTTYRHSDYIPVYEGETIKAEGIYSAERVIMAFYDENKVPIPSLFVRNTTTEIISLTYIKVIYGAKYARFTILKGKESSLSLEYTKNVEHNYFVNNIVKDAYNKTGGRIANLYGTIKKKAVITFTDDDIGSLIFVQRYRNACITNNVVGTYAVLTSQFSGSSIKETLHSYEREGMQCVLHSYSQSDKTAYMANPEPDMVHGLQDLQDAGFLDFHFWITPWGLNGTQYEKLCRRYNLKALVYSSAITDDVENVVNTISNINQYRLHRYELKNNDSNVSLDKIKSAVDYIVENGGWLIVCTHMNNATSGGWDDNGQEIDWSLGTDAFSQICTYAKNNNVEISTLGEGFRIFEPVVNMNNTF